MASGQRLLDAPDNDGDRPPQKMQNPAIKMP
jgi:hypothetical protein